MDYKNKELPKWTEEPFDDTKYIPIEFVEMVRRNAHENEMYYRDIGQPLLADDEHDFFMNVCSLLTEWENNRPQWAEHIYKRT